jgi:tetratricopeptide (TPR) repeat protein
LLNKTGRQLFQKRKKWLLKHLYNASPLPVPAREIDLKQFQSQSFHYNEWLKIAVAASDRRMFLLAAIACDKSQPFSEFQTTWEAEQARRNNQSDIAILNDLQPSARGLFEKANHFWFSEGGYHLVLPIYQEALKYDPTDPVMLYQLAVVLRAFERFDDAVQALDMTSLYQDRLGQKGIELFARRKECLLCRPSYGWLPIPAWEIDWKKLIADNPSSEGWYSISQAAQERRMFLLAYEAYYMDLTYADSETMREAE